MRISELRSRISDYFSDPDTYSQDIVHAELGGLTVNEAIVRGDEPDEIWKAIVRHNPDMPA
ncbi:MAG: DUF3046 domain-containing protein [Actinobacteria bacterium]|nr:DUF3046 domain-containing protein [Actinomycetota bacterium]